MAAIAITPVPDTEHELPLYTPPHRIDQLGVRESLVHELFLKHAFQQGTCSIRQMAGTLHLTIELMEQVFHHMRKQQLVEVKGMLGEDYVFHLSQGGKNAALERMSVSRYCGPVPVPLCQYEQAVRAQVGKNIKINQTVIRKAYADLTLEDDLLMRLGPALVSQGSMFLYGPSGTGKSSLAERMLRIFDQAVAVPYAVEVDGQVIALHDPAVHKNVAPPVKEHDPRWAFCARPCIVVGGELVPEMLELQRDSDTGSYMAPLHMKANNGVFVIDDFGRQMISPRDLLNRWIVPLDRRMDFLALSNGVKFPIPFEVFVVFSTNLAPNELADEAFLRRIPNKILVDAVSERVFQEILAKKLDSSGWSSEEGATDYMSAVCKSKGGDLRPCYPRDFFRIIESIAIFEEREPSLTGVDIDRAADLYFGAM